MFQINRNVVCIALLCQLAFFLVWPALNGRNTGEDPSTLQDEGTRRQALEVSEVEINELLENSPIRLSTYTCTNETDPVTNLCVFKHLVRWNNRLYYLSTDGEATLPVVGITQKCPPEAFCPENCPNGVHCPVDEWASDVITVVSVHSFLHMAAGHKHHVHFKHGLLWRPDTPLNWWHTFDDAAMYHFAWCEGLGLCTYSRAAAEQAVVLVADPRQPLSALFREWGARGGLGTFPELLRCYGQSLLNVQFASAPPEMAPPEDAQPETLFTIERTVVGTGTATGHSYQAAIKRVKVAAPTPLERLQLMGFLRGCVALPSIPRIIDRPPNVVLVNRQYSHGHAMLGLDEVEFRVRAQRPDANVSVVYLEGADFRTQAHMFAHADVVLLAHSPAAANLLFLPLVSGVVHVSATLGEQFYQDSLLADLPPPFEVVNVPITLEGGSSGIRTEAAVATVKDAPDFLSKPDADKLTWLLSDDPGVRFARHIARQESYLLDVDEVTGKVLGAIDRWQETVGHHLTKRELAARRRRARQFRQQRDAADAE